MIIGYCRVSTKKQATANGLYAQAQEILAKYPDALIKREAYTGTSTDRPIFKAILDELKAGDMLVVNKLNRLARNTVEGIQVV